MITRALLSVSDKTGLVEFARFLSERGVELLSTGGTAKALREAGLKVTDVSEVTGFPEIMDGRVKTLHPKVHGGILAVRANTEHQQAMQAHGIAGIDLVVINLYPFEQTLQAKADYNDCVENIDIGGPAMVRAAAKNHGDVTIVVDPADYAEVRAAMEANNGATTLALRKELAQKAFARTASYDAAIANWLAGEVSQTEYGAFAALGGTLKQALRYGENPHQRAAFYTTAQKVHGLATAVQHQGKELSYNNINDTDAAWQLACEFDEPAVAIIKHANPCGVAVGADMVDNFTRALACDPVSAYGGIIALNRPLTAEFVAAMGSLFAEVIIAPEAGAAAIAALQKKKNLRLLTTGGLMKSQEGAQVVKAVAGGFLLQDADAKKIQRGELKTVTKLAPSAAQLDDLLFAFRVCKHVKSNAIVLARGGATIGIGAGQMSRVDSVRLACWKAAAAKLEVKGSVLASDAFFPFDDNVHHAAEAGVAAIIQPGGSIRDDEVIAAADQHGLAMVTTGVRHFRH
jgi:phosphoribosylaminoimidazolecarboxamide formyltransferase / IMP cyclohydrolase